LQKAIHAKMGEVALKKQRLLAEAILEAEESPSKGLTLPEWY